MSDVTHFAAVVAHFQVRVMILAMGYPGQCVHERYRVVVVLEIESLVELSILEFPALNALEEILNLFIRQRRRAALAGLAFLSG